MVDVAIRAELLQLLAGEVDALEAISVALLLSTGQELAVRAPMDIRRASASPTRYPFRFYLLWLGTRLYEGLHEFIPGLRVAMTRLEYLAFRTIETTGRDVPPFRAFIRHIVVPLGPALLFLSGSE